jgi:hypothetical protein
MPIRDRRRGSAQTPPSTRMAVPEGACMRCPSCAFENPEGLKLCNECGAPLRMPCGQCGFANPPQAKFCGACGAALPSQTGASTTLLLGRCGYRVLLVDRATFLSATLSTHLVQQGGVLWLNHWGLLDEIIASRCPSTVQRLSDFGDFPLWVRRRSMAYRRCIPRASPPTPRRASPTPSRVPRPRGYARVVRRPAAAGLTRLEAGGKSAR